MSQSKLPDHLPLNAYVSLNVTASGRIVGRTFCENPRYDIETAEGIICSVPGEWVKFIPTVAALREAS